MVQLQWRIRATVGPQPTPNSPTFLLCRSLDAKELRKLQSSSNALCGVALLGKRIDWQDGESTSFLPQVRILFVFLVLLPGFLT